VGKAKRAHHLEARPVIDGGHGADAPLPTLRISEIVLAHATKQLSTRLFAGAHIAPDENKVHGREIPATLGQKQHEKYEGGIVEIFNRCSRLVSRHSHFDSRTGTDEGSGD
jgi:hypothetical protein